MNKNIVGEKSDIAIIGMGCYYPGASDLKTLWENIVSGKRQFRRFPDQRLPMDLYYDPDRKDLDKTYASQAACIEGFNFDWVKRRIPKKTLETTDIVHWLAYEAALQALDDAGYEKGDLPKDKTGVILGNTLTGEQSRSLFMRQRWPYVNRALEASLKDFDINDDAKQQVLDRTEEYYKSIFPTATEDSLAGGLSNTIAGRICNVLDIHGGGFTVDGACASSLIAVATAADKLINGSLDAVFAGGVDVSMDTFEMVGFSRTGALTPDEMRVYDRRGNGFIPGEGCGFILMKRLDDARRDGDQVYAVLKGWGISSDGRGGITAPNGKYQGLALSRAYEMAGYPASELDFIEGHGTGTTVGDREELKGIATTVGNIVQGDHRSCGLTSFKSIVGHTKAAAGAGGLIKAIMAVNQRVIPPTSNCDDPNPYFETEEAQNIYPVAFGQILEKDKIMRAGVSAMGFGGINSHVTIESGDMPRETIQSSLPLSVLMATTQKTEVYPLAANTIEALISQAKQLKTIAHGMSISELPDLAAQWSKNTTLNSVRASIIANHPVQLNDHLSVLIESLESKPLHVGESRELENKQILVGHNLSKNKVGLLFPGQGSQQLDMAYNLVRRFDWAQKMLEDADKTLRASGWSSQKSLPDIIFPQTDKALNKEQLATWKAELTQTNLAQPAICLASAIWNERLRRLGIIPTMVGGHSLGELSAFHASGAFDYSTLLSLATLRGKAMSSTSETGAMAALMCNVEQAKDVLGSIDDYITIANINDFKQTVVSGEAKAIDQAISIARDRGISVSKLPVSNAFHSHLVKDASDVLRRDANLPDTFSSQYKLVSAMTGQVVEQEISLSDYFADQVQSQVDFISLVQTMSQSCDLLIEVGPGQALSNMARRILGESDIVTMPTEAQAMSDVDLNKLVAHYFVNGGSIDWDALYESRLIREFVPASDKIFIENPCEREFSVSDASPELSKVFQNGTMQPSSSDTRLQEASCEVGFLKKPSHDLEIDEPSTLEQQQVIAMTDSNQTTAQDPKMQSVITTEHPIAALLLESLEESTGFPRESLTLDLRLLDDLNLDSIKAAELIGEIGQKLSISGEIDPAPLANATLEEIVISLQAIQDTGETSLQQDTATDKNTLTTAPIEEVMAPAPAEPSPVVDSSIAKETLLSLIEESTGFPQESLEMDLRLLDDLNLDSIKAAELIGAAAQKLELEGDIDPAQYANATIEELATALTEAGDGTATPQTATASGNRPDTNRVDTTPTPTTVIKAPATHTDRSWVRDFVMRPVQIDLPVNGVLTANSTVVILCEQEEIEFARALAARFKQSGIQTQGASFNALKKNTALLSDANPSYVVVILPRQATNSSTEDAVFKMVERLQSVASVKSNDLSVTVSFTQFSGGSFGLDAAPASIEQCGSMALASSLHLEQKGLRVRTTDFSPCVTAEVFAEKVVTEIVSPDKFIAAAYNKDLVRHVLRPTLHETTLDEPRPIEWNTQDVVMVTGGAKGITAECVLEFAKLTKVKMALVGSTAAPAATDTSSEINTTLKRFAEAGLQARYYSCDLSSGSAVSDLAQKIDMELGAVSGVIHGAALNKPRPMSYVTAEQAYTEISPKVLGTLHLSKTFDQKPLKLFCVLTSIIGVSGMIGNSWYGFSNEVADIILGQYKAKHPETQIISTAFSVWGEVGMGARMDSADYLEKMGIGAIPTKEGVQHFIQLLMNNPKSRQVVVTARLAGLDTWITPSLSTPYSARFLEEITYEYPQVEVKSRAKLTLDTDPYVKDHVWKGSYLFPAVFGLEAMAQAVAYVTGIHEFKNLRIEDITLERPIVVHEKNGLMIQTHARVLAPQPGQQNTRVQVSISTETSDYRATHFAATFVLNGAQSLNQTALSGLPAFPESALDINPKQDLYSWLLFQGPMYQRLKNIYRIDNDFCMFSIDTQRNEEQQWMLGSPYVRDALLQSVQPMVPQDISLPVRIDSIDIANPNSALPENPRGTAVNEALADKEYCTSLSMTNDNGDVLERMEGYQIRILEYRKDYPTVKDIIAPKGHDESAIQTAAAQCARDLRITLPTLKLDYIPNLSKMPKVTRHKVMEPILEQWKLANTNEAVRVNWLEDGKPVFVNQEGKTESLSLSHNCSHLLAVSGEGEHGCDLEVVSQRSENEWKTLLGKQCEPLLAELQTRGDCLNMAGTRLWAVRETIFKASNEFITDIRVKSNSANGMLLNAKTEQGEFDVVTFPVSLLRGGQKMVAITALNNTSQAPEVAKPSLQKASYVNAPKASTLADPSLLPLEQLEAIGYQPAHYYIGLQGDTGPGGSPVFVQRTPLYFKDNQNLSRGIYFANFFLWMGKIRESGTYPIMDPMSEQLITGKWGLVTNSSSVTILGEATSGDIVEVHFWMSKVFGPDKATFDLYYDWRKILPDGSHERIAIGEMRASWVQILDHGLVKPEPLPDYFSEFAKAMGKATDSKVFKPLPETLKSLNSGDVLFSSPTGPRSGYLMAEERLQTTLEDANVVGNVYFSNYARWQGIVRDKFFYNLAPEYFRGKGAQGELITTFCEVEHLREAMPFDNIVITMYVVNIGVSGVDLRFEYYRQDADGTRVKLAVGKQTTVWALKDEHSSLKALVWPEVFKNALIEKTSTLNNIPVNTVNNNQDIGFTFVN